MHVWIAVVAFFEFSDECREPLEPAVPEAKLSEMTDGVEQVFGIKSRMTTGRSNDCGLHPQRQSARILRVRAFGGIEQRSDMRSVVVSQPDGRMLLPVYSRYLLSLS
jgi:hypothetical protein